MKPYAIAEWHFHLDGELCFLRLNIAGGNLTTSGQHRSLIAAPSVDDSDDLDNFGWSALPDTLGWLRAKHEELLEQGWVLISPIGTAKDYDISVPGTPPKALAPWPESNVHIAPAVL